MAALVVAERAAREGRVQAALAALSHTEQIEREGEEALRNMAPGLMGEAKLMERELEKLSNLLSDPNAPVDPARIHPSGS